jgi:hypothetical protein
MKVWIQFHSSGYASPEHGEYEEFDSIRQAKSELARRINGHDRRFPCVAEDATMTMWVGKPRDDDPYPDFILSMGPRGGIRMEYV